MPDIVTTALVLAHPAPADTALVLGLPLPSVAPPVEVSGSVLLLPVVSGQGEAWRVVPLLSAVRSPAWAPVQSARVAAAPAWRTSRAASGAAPAWVQARPLLSARPVRWASGQALRAARFAAWRQAAPARSVQRLAWAQGRALRWPRALAWRSAALASAVHTQLWGPAVRLARVGRLGWAPFVRAAAGRAIVWRPADRIARQLQAALPGARVLVSAGAWPVIVVVPEPCCTVDTALVLQALAPASSALVFVCDLDAQGEQPATVVIPIRQAYHVTNSTYILRADTSQHILAPSFSLSLDRESWAWRLQASGIPASFLSVLTREPGEPPVRLLVHVNGTNLALIVRSVSRERQFGKSSLSMTADSRSILLDAPFARSRTHGSAATASAQQLAEAALTENGVPLGWSLDWQIDDWSVPAVAWSHQGTPISAVRTIAAAVGAYVQPHNTADTLQILPAYPAPPWEWAGLTPDVELPTAVVQREGIEWAERPDYNRVYLAGSAGGRIGQVTRAGTDGGIEAPAVVDPLLTATAALRQRGVAVLSDTGAQAQVVLRVPVLPELGLLRPGVLVRYVDGSTTRLGLVRSLSIDRTPPALWQTVTVETHV